MKAKVMSLALILALSNALFATPPVPTKPQPHIKGVLPEVFNNASFDKKREALKADFKEREAIDKKREELRGKIKALELEKKILEINLQEAKATRDDTKINATLAQIVQQEAKISQEKAKEKQIIAEMEQSAISKINKILGY
ncbi:hypothetical protein [Helicobacter sp. UBA3407]|uniref:hypothetical protein n=1 Tax=Helicobacter sp. UBA3407 TaxID=1946588 RepID=UPI00261D7A06|nr:hypothetical protein [Helicobacter sp. UBA3407]